MSSANWLPLCFTGISYALALNSHLTCLLHLINIEPTVFSPKVIVSHLPTLVFLHLLYEEQRLFLYHTSDGLKKRYPLYVHLHYLYLIDQYLLFRFVLIQVFAVFVFVTNT